MIGADAGEIGQTQLLPSSYVKYGVDDDSDGSSICGTACPTCSPSTADLVNTNGWRFGEGSANFEVISEWNRSAV